MTTVLISMRPTSRRPQVKGILRQAVLVCLVSGLPAAAQGPPVHWLHAGAMPPGAIGSQRLMRGGPLSGYFQPVRIRAPQGARIALATEGGYGTPQVGSALVGMQVGLVYQVQVTDIPNYPGHEVFPTVEIIDRTYPPAGLALRYPVPIELTQDELEMAIQGMFVTRIVYIEDPLLALPVARHHSDEQPWFEARSGDDPLVVADRLGRPIAIVRIGGRVPSSVEAGGALRGAPPLLLFDEPAAADPIPPAHPPTQYE